MGISAGRVLSDPTKESRVEATLALVFYSVNDSLAVLEHTVEPTPSGPVIGPGRVLTLSSMDGLLRKVAGQREAHGLLPEGLLVNDPGLLAWVVPGCMRPMWLAGKATATAPKRLMVPWPTLLFVVRDGMLSLAALKTSRRPSLKDPVFHAPLMNVYDRGTLCMGSNQAASEEGVGAVEHWEKVMFESNFTHVNHPLTLKLSKGGNEVSDAAHIRFWRGLVRERVKQFPAKALMPMRRRTVNSFIFGKEREL